MNFGCGESKLASREAKAVQSVRRVRSPWLYHVRVRVTNGRKNELILTEKSRCDSDCT